MSFKEKFEKAQAAVDKGNEFLYQANHYGKSKDQVKAAKMEKALLKCPNCGSNNVEFVKNKRKFSIGKAIGGSMLSFGVGGLAGFIGKDGKKNIFVCMNCGKEFKKWNMKI